MSEADLADNAVRIGKFIVMSTMAYVALVVVLAWLRDHDGRKK